MTHTKNKKGTPVNTATQGTCEAAMSNFISHADVNHASIDGQRLGEEVLNQVGAKHADPDLLFFSLQQVLREANNVLAFTKLRGCLRVIQNALTLPKASRENSQ
jgi:hypothetical protein